MAQLIEAMKLAQQYSTTLLDNEYRRGMLKAAHILAMDSKNLLDSVDNARKRVAGLNSVGAGSRESSAEKEAELCRQNSHSISTPASSTVKTGASSHSQSDGGSCCSNSSASSSTKTLPQTGAQSEHVDSSGSHTSSSMSSQSRENFVPEWPPPPPDEELLRRDFAASVTLTPSLSPSPEPDSTGTHNSKEDTYSREFEESLGQTQEEECPSGPVTDEDSSC